MAKHDSQPTEYTWDTGTYQTGTSKPNKNQSAVITALLITTIFLGSIASALGIMNVRLLNKLVKQQQGEMLPLAVDATGGTAGSFLRENNYSAPEIPENRHLELALDNTAAAAAVAPEQILQKNQASMVTVFVETSRGGRRSGPGLVLSADGYLLTNAHVTENAEQISVEFSDGTSLQAALVGCDVYSDLSVLYVPAQTLMAPSFAQPVIPVPLQESVYALSGDGTLCSGSLLSGDLTRADGGRRMLAVGEDALMLELTSFDLSAGPVFDGSGNVIGFLCRTVHTGEEAGLMLSSDQIVDIVTQLVEQGGVSGRPSLGLQVREISSFCQQYWALSGGLEVTAISGGTNSAGLMEGDILLALNGAGLTTRQQFYEALLSLQIGDSVTLEVFRAGQAFNLTVPVGQIP